jgi:NADH:ubiquinone oxidoreductase subunit 6 (subunit J)
VALPQTIPFLGWAWDDLIFLVLAGVTLGGSLLVVVSRDIIRSGLYMILAFAALAGLYVLLGAAIVAAAQVLIYIGAISVLVLFAIMLTQSKAAPSELVFHRQSWAGGLAAIVFAVLFLVVILFTDWPLEAARGVAATTGLVAGLLFSDYVLAFEVVSVLLLAAVIGGVFLAKREDSPDPGTSSADEPTLGRVATPDPFGGRREPGATKTSSGVHPGATPYTDER